MNIWSIPQSGLKAFVHRKILYAVIIFSLIIVSSALLYKTLGNKISKKEYTIKKGDTLWKIAQEQLGSGHHWEYLYEFNKDIIKNPDKLKPGQKIIIPVE